MNTIGKLLILTGTIILAVGIILYFKDTIPFLKNIGKLPGDIHIRRENYSFYFPITTSIIASIFISLVLYLISKFKG